MPRMSFEMDEKFIQTLTRLADGGNAAEALQKAVSTYAYLKSKVPNGASQNNVAITDADGKIINTVTLP